MASAVDDEESSRAPGGDSLCASFDAADAGVLWLFFAAVVCLCGVVRDGQSAEDTAPRRCEGVDCCDGDAPASVNGCGEYCGILLFESGVSNDGGERRFPP